MDAFDKLTLSMLIWAFVLIFAGAPIRDISSKRLGEMMLKAGFACAVIGTISFVLG